METVIAMGIATGINLILLYWVVWRINNGCADMNDRITHLEMDQWEREHRERKCD